MNKDTVYKCAQMAANQQQAFLGAVDQDILDLLAEVSPAPVEAAPVVEEPVAEEVEEVVAEEAEEPVADSEE